ncbi:MAG TPA: copper transporter [Nakamurella multipartita]|mgnify:CR=1 FL=1|nr:copper transporter [Nakamurella multipartita]
MISMRYHIVSLAAVFLALALGIVLGATKIQSPLLEGLRDDNASLSSQQGELASTNQDLTARVAADEKFAGSVGALTVRGTLPSTNVVLVTTAAADPNDRDALLSLLNRAGATVTGQIQLTNDFSDPLRADELRQIATTTLPTGVQLPEVPQAGAVAGGLLSSVLIAPAGGAPKASAEQGAAVLAALQSAGFITVTGTPAAGQSVIVLTGEEVTGGSEADKAGAVASFATQLAQTATGVVVAGRSGSDESTGTVGVIRGDTAMSGTVSTVDNVDSDTGRIATVLALVEQNGGGQGQYGFGEKAQAQAPTLAVG